MLLNLKTGLYFSLNEVGNRTWQLIAELEEMDKVRGQLEKEYEADPAVLSRDLQKLVDDLRNLHLIREIAEETS